MTSYDHQDPGPGPGPLPVIAPRGEFDYETVPLLQARIDAAVVIHGGVILDAANVTFTDSVFLTMLLATHQRSHLRIANPSPRLAHILSIYGVDQVLHIYPTLHAARTA
ncbi:STAS domain-containing protein [Streptomyces rubiginosohelvolus]